MSKVKNVKGTQVEHLDEVDNSNQEPMVEERSAPTKKELKYVISASDIGKLDGLVISIMSAEREGVLDAKAGLAKLIDTLRSVIKPE